MTTQVVPTGPYFGFTLYAGTNDGANLEDEMTRYLAARRQAGSRLQGASVNGESYQFGVNRSDWSLDEWSNELQIAFFYLDPGRYPFTPPTNAAAATFV